MRERLKRLAVAVGCMTVLVCMFAPVSYTHLEASENEKFLTKVGQCDILNEFRFCGVYLVN